MGLDEFSAPGAGVGCRRCGQRQRRKQLTDALIETDIEQQLALLWLVDAGCDGMHAERACEPHRRAADLESVGIRAHRAGPGGIDLQPREFRLLEYLMRHAGQVVTRTMLLESVWEYHFDPQTNVIDVHISRLRAKIDKGFEAPLLHTVRGAGYMIRARA